MKKIILVLILSLTVAGSVYSQNSPPNSPTDLLCNGQSNPTGLADFTPELSWTFDGPDIDDSQSGYQVLISSNIEELNSNIGGEWDSGKVISVQSTITCCVGYLYLREGVTYYWKIRTWDNHDSSGPYSQMATFSMIKRSYYGIPHRISGKIECEDFDNGGEGYGYHDIDTTNQGGQYRPSEGVDIYESTDTGGGYYIGDTEAGEWIEYLVDGEMDGSYTIEMRIASEGVGGTFHIESDGIDVTDSMQMPDTGGWQNWITATKTGVCLRKGKHIMKISMDSNGTNGKIGNFNYINIMLEGCIPYTITVLSPNGGETWIPGTYVNVLWSVEYLCCTDIGNVDIDLSTDGGSNWMTILYNTENDGIENITVPNIPSTECKIKVRRHCVSSGGDTSDADFIITSATGPYHGIPMEIPGRIDIEDFDLGGEGIAYHDTTISNDGGEYRLNEGVDIETCSDVGEGYNVTLTEAGEWLEYTVDVLVGGYTYDIETRVASEGPGGTFHIEFDGTDITGSLPVPDTGGWQNWMQIVKVNVCLSIAGKHVVRLSMDSNGASGKVGNFNCINFWLCSLCPDSIITVTSPNGGETWDVGTQAQVTWTSQGVVGNVNINLSTNGGSNWVALVSSTTNDGSELVTVPNSPSTTCRIRVDELEGYYPSSDISDNNFTIQACIGLPSISVNKSSLNFSEVEIGKTKTLNFEIRDVGACRVLTGTISTNKKWIEVNPTSFKATSIVITSVTVDNSILNMRDGRHTGTIIINSNDYSNSPLEIGVTLTATCILVRPNPYNPKQGALTFFGDGVVPKDTEIKIYTLSGELVKKLTAGDSPEVTWNGVNEQDKPMISGIYIYTYESPKEKGVGKFTVIKK